MKKTLALALAMIAILSLAACGAKEEAPAPTEISVANVIAPAVAQEEVVAAPVEESITTGFSPEIIPFSAAPSAEPAA